MIRNQNKDENSWFPILHIAKARARDIPGHLVSLFSAERPKGAISPIEARYINIGATCRGVYPDFLPESYLDLAWEGQAL